jgi:hypothetical protein
MTDDWELNFDLTDREADPDPDRHTPLTLTMDEILSRAVEEARERGRKDGYGKGYVDGVNAVALTPEEERHIYRAGYIAGWDEGFEAARAIDGGY